MKNIRTSTIAIFCVALAALAWGLTPADLTFIQKTDTIGGSRTIINSNDWLLADASGGGASTNGNNTFLGTNTFSDIVVTNLTGPGTDNFFKIDADNVAAPATLNTFQSLDAIAIDTARMEADSIYVAETATPGIDIAGFGQFVVSNTVPNTPYFIADDGTISPLAGSGSGGGGGTSQDATTLHISAVDTGLVAFTTTKGTNGVDLQTVRAIGGGTTTAQINQGLECSLLGGSNNRIIVGVTRSVIGGGQANDISIAGANACTISGGINNGIDTARDNHTIGGGSGNTINQTGGDSSTIGGGANNLIGTASTIDTIAGGSANQITGGSQSFIGGGNGNVKSASGTQDVISGGLNNLISITGGKSVISGGDGNTIEGPHNVIDGGEDNFIGDNTTSHSVIGGGQLNTIDPTTGSHNTILGGRGNNMPNTISSCSYNLLWGNDVDVTAAGVNGGVGLGYDAKVAHAGAFVFKDRDGSDFTSGEVDQFVMQFDNGIGININNTEGHQLYVEGSARFHEAVADKTAAYTLVEADSVITTSGASSFTLTLPSAATVGLKYFIKNNGTGTITVDGDGTEEIDGATTATLSSQYQSITIISDGAGWGIY